MKRILSFGLLVLVATMITSGMTISAAAQDDPAILYRIAKNAQVQIQNNISNESPDEIKKLFEEGSLNVDSLEEALGQNDVESAREYFLSAMKVFKEISKMQSYDDVATQTIQRDDPSSTLKKLYQYSTSLQKISEKYQISIDFSILDGLFDTARGQIQAGQYSNAQNTIEKIEQIVKDIEKQIREQALLREPERAQQYAQMYLGQLDRLIELAKNQQISDDIIQKLLDARESLSSATIPEEIVKEIRKIIVLKDQFDLTASDSTELNILKVERTIQRLSQMDVDTAVITDLQGKVIEAKQLLAEGNTEQANILLVQLKSQLQQITESIS